MRKSVFRVSDQIRYKLFKQCKRKMLITLWNVHLHFCLLDSISLVVSEDMLRTGLCMLPTLLSIGY